MTKKELRNNSMTKLLNPEKISNSVIRRFSNSARRSSASSLIFVMLVVAGIVTVTLGVQRLALVQFGQSSADEDNVAAYYAAKAGIEDGLVRFRFGRNVDTIRRDTNGAVLSTAERYDLTAGSAVGNVQDNTTITSTSGYNPVHQYYDLKVDYKTTNAALTLASPIAQDDSLELTGFPDSTNDYYLRYQFSWTGNPSGCSVTIQQINQNGSGTQFQPQVVVSQIGSQPTYDSAAQGTNLLIRGGTGGGSVASTLRIRPLGTSGVGSSCYNLGSVGATFSTVTSSSGTTSANVNFDSTVSKITATGYAGATKRTLLATVDRKSGTLLSIYDFNVYGGTGNVTP
ncbi:MAG TPA: hypothetical protein VLE93_02170 [Candidatus Saccharimonadales bacterium]|nr:hypothetical protein [Candidatus Saccharimonadales bacterium]